MRLIKSLARLPHKYGTWLGWGHTVPNGDPAQPYAPNTALNGSIVLPSISVPDAFHRLRIDDEKEIVFYAVVPIRRAIHVCRQSIVAHIFSSGESIQTLFGIYSCVNAPTS